MGSFEEYRRRMLEVLAAAPVPEPSFPPLTFRPEEWRMRVPGSQYDPVAEAMSELDREDEIMSAVRAVARGG